MELCQGLQVFDLHKTFGSQQVLAGVSFCVGTGEIVALLGPSGCGKSTTLSLIAGLEKTDRGEITWEGKPLAGIPPHQRGFGMVFQDLALFPHLNVFENIAFGLRRIPPQARLANDPGELKSRVTELLELVGLPGIEKRDISTLSGGEQQRVALARALAPRPALLMMDEPLGSLDRGLRERLVVELRLILQHTHQTAIYVTHDQEEAFMIADRVALMNNGRIEQDAPPQTLYQSPASPFVARFLGMTNLVAGQVIHTGDQTWVDFTLGRIPAPHNWSAAETSQAGRVTVLLRPETAQLDGGGDIQIMGTVTRHTFRGDTCQVTLEAQTAQPPSRGFSQTVPLTFTFPSTMPIPAEGEPIQINLDAGSGLQVFTD